ncbi:putative cystathionine beta-lyase [Ascoidea rubescens DSM 1968]|uniref:Cystathionine gamma-synthase n=1 Tax=Ascoidea rubescens DSM 1968 TaxID=1344418 RepID=A0A1D2VKW8_9ASCO|nr:cystathionine gamma-synthase [Ascoidea rubescens DSM 1968]ODV62246.1 cystathionine gamma-synthase [Ascoidea rubescens DSM 1968]
MTGIQTTLIHGADSIYERVSDVVPPINVSTTFKYPQKVEELIPVDDQSIDSIAGSGNFIYSRLSHPNSEALELTFKKLFGKDVVVYSSGLAAFNAILFHYSPKRIFIDHCYAGCHGIVNLFKRFGLKEFGVSEEELKENLSQGDLIHIETPVNPEGTSYDIEYFTKIAHERGAYVSVDSTFAPFPLQDPFLFEADIVMHSATKYYGGHSDLLSGLLVVKDDKIKAELVFDRVYLGTNIGNLESYLLIRSLRTFKMRIEVQSKNCEKLVKYLNDNKEGKFSKVIDKIYHSSLQKEEFVARQLPNGYGPVFSIDLVSEDFAKRLAANLKYFQHATSLGGVESLIEWRALSAPKIRRTLVRISVGCEEIEDLIEDIEQGLLSL